MDKKEILFKEPFDIKPDVFSINPKYVVFAKYVMHEHLDTETSYHRGRHCVAIYTHDGRWYEFEVKSKKEAEWEIEHLDKQIKSLT